MFVYLSARPDPLRSQPGDKAESKQTATTQKVRRSSDRNPKWEKEEQAKENVSFLCPTYVPNYTKNRRQKRKLARPWPRRRSSDLGRDGANMKGEEVSANNPKANPQTNTCRFDDMTILHHARAKMTRSLSLSLSVCVCFSLSMTLPMRSVADVMGGKDRANDEGQGEGVIGS